MVSQLAKSTVLTILVLVWASEWSQIRSSILADSHQACLSQNIEESQCEKLQLDSLLSSFSAVSLQVDFLTYEASEPLGIPNQNAEASSHQLRGPPANHC